MSGDGGRPLLANRYSLNEVIGEGAYGVVASATDTASNKPVAVKRIRKVLDTYPMATRILRELKFLRLLSGHENIIEVKDILVPSDRDRFNDTFVVFELMPCDLYRVISSSAPLNDANIKFLMFQLLRGVHYMHAAGVLHRDLKPSNVLVDSMCRLKVCDFGLARATIRAKEESDADLVLWTDYVATRWYRAPELLLPRSTNYSTAIDLWSCGCIFAEMILRRPLFPGDDAEHQLNLITELTGKPELGAIQRLGSTRAMEVLAALPSRGAKDLRSVFPADTDPAVLRLIGAMLEFDPERRITAREALQDDYFKCWREPLGFGPPPRHLEPAEFEFERRMSTQDRDALKSIRLELLTEIIHYHPDKRAELLGTAAAGSFDMPSQSDAFGQQWEDRGKGVAARAGSMPMSKLHELIERGEARDRKMGRLPTMPDKELAQYKAGAGKAAKAAADAAAVAAATVPPSASDDMTDQ